MRTCKSCPNPVARYKSLCESCRLTAARKRGREKRAKEYRRQCAARSHAPDWQVPGDLSAAAIEAVITRELARQRIARGKGQTV